MALALDEFEIANEPPIIPRPRHCTPKEIEEKRLKARIRLANHKRGNALKDELEDVFPPTEAWPAYPLRIILDGDLGYNNHLSLATFFHGNGLWDADLAVKIYQFYNSKWRHDQEWTRRFTKFRTLFQYFSPAADTKHPKYPIMSQNYYSIRMR